MTEIKRFRGIIPARNMARVFGPGYGIEPIMVRGRVMYRVVEYDEEAEHAN